MILVESILGNAGDPAWASRLAGATVDPISCRTVLRVERGFEIRNGRRRRPLGPFELTGGVTEILAGIDPVATDAWAFEHLLQRSGRLPDYLYMAEQKGSGRVNYRALLKVIT